MKEPKYGWLFFAGIGFLGAVSVSGGPGVGALMFGTIWFVGLCKAYS